jgi:hypothetical protein
MTAIDSLELRGIGFAPAGQVVLAPRINLFAGDNSTGKTLVLDTLWWALTGMWAGSHVWPGPAREGGSEAAIVVGSQGEGEVQSHFDGTREQWVRAPRWPSARALVLYARVDGSFCVWDPIRNLPTSQGSRVSVLESYQFTAQSLWEGLLSRDGTVLCNGLLRDWVDWQFRRTELFDKLREALIGLSSQEERLKPGRPARVSIHQALDVPTLELSYATVPVTYTSAAVKRVLSLAYLLVWTWSEHREAARLAGQPEAEQVVLLLDEVESHLHPKWQRLLLPSLLRVIEQLAESKQVQLIASTHAPLVLASLESHFDPERDRMWHFELQDGRLQVTEQPWAAQGDVVNWLVSEAFGLKQARSKEAEEAIEAAKAFMRGQPLPGIDTREKIEERLQRSVPGHDPFWPRWVVKTEGA